MLSDKELIAKYQAGAQPVSKMDGKATIDARCKHKKRS